MSFFTEQRAEQIAGRRNAHLFPVAGTRPGTLNGRAHAVLLPDDAHGENFFPPSAGPINAYFDRYGIVKHRMLHHLLSSQACCLNFLMPFMDRPEALAALLQPVFPGKTVEPQRIDEPDGPGGYIAFEWVDCTDPLGEAGGKKPTRGANCTSTDAAVSVRVDGQPELVLIEWKYTENYGARLAGGDKSRRTRERRYGDLAFTPDGPIKATDDVWLTDFFYEPFYQLLRQQMLAFQVEAHGDRRFSAVRVLHIAPRANDALTLVTSPEFARRARDRDAFTIFSDLLVQKDRFLKHHIEDLFGDFAADRFDMSDWLVWAKQRYAFAFRGRTPDAG